MLFHPHDKKKKSGMEKREIVHIAKIGEKREKTFNFSPFCGIINYIRNKTNLIQMLDFTVFVHISKCIKIVQVKRRIPDYIWNIFAISYSGNKKVMKQFQKISKDLYIFYGVSEDDIKKKTERYLSLVTALSS